MIFTKIQCAIHTVQSSERSSASLSTQCHWLNIRIVQRQILEITWMSGFWISRNRAFGGLSRCFHKMSTMMKLGIPSTHISPSSSQTISKLINFSLMSWMLIPNYTFLRLILYININFQLIANLISKWRRNCFRCMWPESLETVIALLRNHLNMSNRHCWCCRFQTWNFQEVGVEAGNLIWFRNFWTTKGAWFSFVTIPRVPSVSTVSSTVFHRHIHSNASSRSLLLR